MEDWYPKRYQTISMKTICIDEKINEFINAHLTEKRTAHVYAVRDTAKELAIRYGEDPRKAEIAALCHDLFKCFDVKTIDAYVKKYKLPKKYLNNKNLSHGKIAAAFAKEELCIDDDDILNAISFHTTGRAGMSKLEKIVYLADAIEPNRRYDEVHAIRIMSKKDLDRAVIMTLEGSVRMLERHGKEIDKDTIKALSFMKK